jgi:hypothetical protein
MNFINWGNESPEQLAIRKKLEEHALYEQMVKIVQAKKSQGQSPFGGAGGSVRTLQSVQTVETQMFFFKELDGLNWKYYVLDFNNANVIGPFDSGVTSADYNFDSFRIVQNKGYLALFRGVEDSNDYTMLFMKVDGTLVDTVSGYTSDLQTYSYGGYFIMANDYDAALIWQFDGETLITDSTTAAGSTSYSFGSQEDSANRHGIILIKNIDTVTEYYLLTMSGAKLLTSFDTSETPDLQAYSYCYELGNTVSIVTQLTSTNQTLGVSVYNKDGNLVSSYEFDDDTYIGYNYYAYGTDKFLMIAANEDGLDNKYRLVQYSDSAGQFQSWTQVRTPSMGYAVNYLNRSSSSFSDYAISENIAVIFHNSSGGAANNMTLVSNCTIQYVFGNGVPQSYSFTGTSLNLDLRVGAKAFFTWIDEGDGAFKHFALTQTGTSVLDLNLDHAEVDGYDTIVAGEKHYLQFGLTTGGSRVFMINQVGSTQAELDLSEYAELNYVVEYDTVVVTADTDQWYMNSITPTWVQVSKYSEWDTPNSYYTPSLSRPGHIVSLNTGQIPYTHTQLQVSGEISDIEDFISDGQIVTGSNLDFGAGSSYFTNLYPGLFVLCAKNTDINLFKIDGNIGADGNGEVDTYQYSYNGYTAFVKRVYGTSDPSINHIIIIEGDGTGVSQIVDLNSGFDLHQIFNIPSSSNELHYLLMAKPQGIKITDLEIDSIVENYIDLVVGKNISTILTDLGTNYSNVTSVLADRGEPTDDRIYWFTDAGEAGEISDGGDDMYDGANLLYSNYTSPKLRVITRTSIVQNISVPDLNDYRIGSDGILAYYYDLERSGQITILFFDLAGNEVRRVETDHVNVYNSDLIKNRGYLHCFSKEFDGEETIYRWTVYLVNLKGAKSVTFYTADNTNDFRYSLNDYPWFD